MLIGLPKVLHNAVKKVPLFGTQCCEAVKTLDGIPLKRRLTLRFEMEFDLAD